MSASLVYPLVMKLVTHYLAEYADDSPTIADFKCDPRAAMDNHFALSMADTTSHPFVTQRWRSGGSYFEDRLITDYHMTMIGYRKKTSFTYLRKSPHTNC